MVATATRQTDIFAITVLIVAVALVVFLVIASIFFFNIFNYNKASTAEATFLFATAIILAAICVGIAIYAIIKIIRHRTIIVSPEPAPAPVQAPVLTISSPVQPVISSPVYVAPPVVETPPPPLPVRQEPLTNNVPRVSSSLSLGVADMPLNQASLTQSALPKAVTQRPSLVNQSLSAISGSESSLEQAITTVSGFD